MNLLKNEQVGFDQQQQTFLPVACQCRNIAVCKVKFPKSNRNQI